MAKKLKTPHDAFTQLMLEVKDIALSFFIANLPKQLVDQLDWSTLTIADAVVRPEGKKALYTDITYHVYTHAPQGSVYLHVEQERKIDPTMSVRNDQYEAALNLKHLKQGHKKLGLIHHIVLYNGNIVLYPDPSDLESRFERPDLLAYFPNIPQCPFEVVNLNLIDDAQLAAQGPCGLMTLLLKKGGSANFLSWMANNKALLRSLTVVEEMVVSCFDYIYNISEEEPKEIVDTFVRVYPEQKDHIMTARIRDRRDAMQQGLQQGILQVAENMLRQLHIGIDKVQQATGLSRGELERIAQQA